MTGRVLHLIAPIRGDVVNEGEVLGAAVWLWMHSARHRTLSLQALQGMLLPVIRAGQYVLAIEAGRPVCYMAWAWFDAEAEARYLAEPERLFDPSEWSCGDRFWVIDWVAPFGHSRSLRYLLDEDLLSHSCSRILCRTHKGRAGRVLQHRGRRVTVAEARAYFRARPPGKADGLEGHAIRAVQG